MASKDFQNGFALGLISKGVALQHDKLLDHTLTFKAGDEDYAIMSVAEGLSVEAPIPDPVSTEGIFECWMDDEDIAYFPYELRQDKLLTAKFIQARTEISTNVAGTMISSAHGTKNNGTLAWCGYVKETKNNVYYPFMVSRTIQGTFTSNWAESTSAQSFIYEGKTYYYNFGRSMSGEDNFTDGDVDCYYVGSIYTLNGAVELQYANQILNYYFKKI